MTIEDGDEVRELRCRWLLDATGRVNFLGRRLGLIERNDEHPTAAIWCRWKGVRHIDDIAARPAISPRATSARGAWPRITTWASATGSGSFRSATARRRSASSSTSGSIDLHHSKDRATDFIAFLKAIPALAELLDGAAPRLDDLRFYSHLPYVTKQYMGNGWALLGDAAAFLDPYYSPGLDHASFTVEATVEIVGLRRERGGHRAPASPSTTRRSSARTTASSARSTRTSTTTWASTTCSRRRCSSTPRSTTSSWSSPPTAFAKKFHWMPVLGPKPAFFSYHLIKIYNRRFKAIALARRAAGEAGARNNGRRIKRVLQSQSRAGPHGRCAA